MADSRGLAAYMDEQGIERAVVTCFPFADDALVRDANDYVLDAGRADGRLIPFVTVDRCHEGKAVAEAERCLKQGARGVGEIAWYDRAFGEEERRRLEGLARFMEETGMVFMMHLNEQVGHPYPGKAAADFAEVTRLIEDHPGLNVILAHLGGGICFYEFMPEIRRAFALVYYDLAAAPFLYLDALYHFAATFLADKVLFGSDYPLITLARYRPPLDKLSDEVKEKFLSGNGRRLFGG
jgi:predicted TIM-barrel fold metal-dependent hydrolase